MVQVNQEKMSKSLGNFFTLRDVLQSYDAETLRYFLLSAHYRSQLNYSEENIVQSRAALERLYTALRDVQPDTGVSREDSPYVDRFNQAMDDDFNTPEAFAVLFDLARDINKNKDNPLEASQLAGLLLTLGGVLGLLQQAPTDYLQGAASSALDVETIEQLIQARNQARANKDWAGADKARDELTALGVVLEDGVNGTTWRQAQ
jgi:cysteinyl-tRNA synthetase